jgi:hypothetical protein
LSIIKPQCRSKGGLLKSVDFLPTSIIGTSKI